MNGDGFKSKTLKEFFNDTEAPSGFVYFLNDEPVMQIDLFEKFYTLFWLGPTNPQTLINFFSDILSELKNSSPIINSIFSSPALAGSVSVIVDQGSLIVESERFTDPPTAGPQTPRSRYKKEVQTLNWFDALGSDLLTRRLYNFITHFRTSAVSILCEVKTASNNRDYEVSLWADTQRSEKTDKETGITSNFPLTNSLMELVQETCPAARAMLQSDFDVFMSEIRSQIADRRYY